MLGRFRFIILATFVLFAIVSLQPAAAQSGPVAAYAFNEGAGTTAGDATGNGRTGTLSGATWTTAGRYGGALTFNGTNARVNVADHALLDLTAGMTLQAWVYPTGLVGYRTVILKERPGDLAYALYANETTSRPSSWITAGTSATAPGTTPLPLNAWTHLTATYDGAVLRTYVNGVQVGSQTHGGSIFVSASPLRIGGNAIWGEYFQGRIDEVRIYARALSAAEILTDMNTPVAPPIDAIPPTVAVTSPVPDLMVSGTIDLSATASDNIAVVGVQFLIDGSAAGAEDTSNPYSVQFDTRTLTNALHQVTARARDAAGNITTSAAVPITASNPPRLVITSPASGAAISGTTIPISYTTAGDLTGYAVDHVHFQIDGGPERMDVTFDGVHQLANVAAGTHVLSGFLVRGDHSKIPGTDATSVNFTNTIPDTTAPVVDITAPAAAATISGTIQVDATASDNVGVAGVQFLLDGAALGAEDTLAPYSVSWSTTATANGSHVLTARARDAATNTTTSAEVTITVENTGPANLVVGYAFDEGSGTTAIDASGNGLNGTLSAATWTTSGHFGGALSFNGTSALVTVADHALLDLTTGMTLQAWVYPTALSAYRTVILKERPADLAYALYAHDGAPRPSAWITAGTPATATGTTALPLNTWTHLATTYDGAILRLYVNGVQVGSQAHTGSLFVSGNALRIGGNTIWGEYFQGRLDEVRVYSRALSAAEIQSSMNTPISAPPPPPTTWSISGSITPSSAGNGASVSITGAGSASTTADANGNYTVSGLVNGAYTVTPSKAGFTFTPVNRSVSISGSNMSGINFTGASTTDPAVVGQWAAPFEMGVVAVNMVLLHTGSVLFYSGTFATTGIERLWNPTTGNFTDVPLGRTNLFCSAHSQLADGRILVIGGHEPESGLLGSREVNIFDPVSQSWTPGPSMSDPRWYPTATTLGDGRVLAVSGGTTCLTCIADVPEIYNPVTNSWSRLTGARLAFPYYPFMFLLPDSRVVDAGANESAVATRTLDVATQTWTMIDPIVVDGHSAAMYRPGQIIKTGTATDSGKTGTAAATAYVIDMNQPSPTWRQVPSMANARAFHNTVVLPTGDVLVTGGGTRRDGYDGSFAIRGAELWSPVTETWRTLSSMQYPRLYHSGALLLPDARVLIAGGGNDGPAVNYTQGEIFSPPYLFKGPRPVITSTPPQAQYSSTFVVDTPDAANITGVSLMRPGAVTHAFDEDARFLTLTFEIQSGRVIVDAPANANLAPPGYYMLFLLAGEVPSTAAFIRLPSPADDTTPPTAPTNLVALAGIGTATLSWTASTDDTGVTAYNVHRATAPGIVPTTANRIARTSATGFVDTLAGGSYSYVVTAEDANGNLSTTSNETSVVVLEDVTPPSVAMTSPADGAQVGGVVAITATASDDIGVVGVQFELDQTPLGAEDTSLPYTFNWPTTSAPNGVYVLTAVARDAQGHQTRSSGITVTVSNAQAPTGLVAAYGFNELTGSIVGDASGNGNGGQINNAVWSASGRYGGALQFNGTTSMVSVTDAASLDLTTGMTLSAWVSPSQLSGWRTVIMKERTGDLAYGIYAHDQAPRPAGYISVPNQVTVPGTGALTLNNWTHLAVTYDGASLALFVNGTEVRRVAAPGSMTTSASMLRIGGNSVWGEYFSGLIDEVRVYNRALTAIEIQTDMNTPVGGS